MSPDLPREVLLADILQGKPFCEFCTPLKVTNGWTVVHRDDVAWLTKLTKHGKPQKWSLDVSRYGYVSCGGFESYGGNMHRAVMRATPGMARVDHRNGVRHHNCRCNLRLCDDTVHNGKSKALAKPRPHKSGLWFANMSIGNAGQLAIYGTTEDECKRVINYLARFSGRTEHYHDVKPLFPVDPTYADSRIARAEEKLKERARILEQAMAIEDTGRYVVQVKDASDKNVLRDVIVGKRGKFILSMEPNAWRVHGVRSVSSHSGIFSGQRLHALVFGQSCQRVSVDHINNNALDNRLSNLRASTNRTNALNAKDKRAPGWRGATWNARDRCWYTTVNINGKQFNGGCFIAREQAALAYDVWQHWLGLTEGHAEFRRFNYPTRKPVVAVTADMPFEEVRAALYAWRGPFDSSKVVHEEFVAPSGKTKC